MGARYLEHAPPSDDYELDGWKCVYHVTLCHNPLDCDFVPLWILKPEARRALWQVEALKRQALIEAGGCTTCSHPEAEHTRLPRPAGLRPHLHGGTGQQHLLVRRLPDGRLMSA